MLSQLVLTINTKLKPSVELYLRSTVKVCMVDPTFTLLVTGVLAVSPLKIANLDVYSELTKFLQIMPASPTRNCVAVGFAEMSELINGLVIADVRIY